MAAVLVALAVGYFLGIICAILLIIKKNRISFIEGMRRARALLNITAWNSSEFEMSDTEGNSLGRYDRAQAMRKMAKEAMDAIDAEIYVEEHGHLPESVAAARKS